MKSKNKSLEELFAEENAELRARAEQYDAWKSEITMASFASETELRWLYNWQAEPREANLILLNREFAQEFPAS